MSGPKVLNPDFPIFCFYYHNAVNTEIIFLGPYHKIFPQNDLEGFLCNPNIDDNGLHKKP
jgi:hypothetical protein